MKVTYFSEKLNKHFDSEEACVKAEQEYDKKFEIEKVKKEERAKEAKEVEEAYKKANEAYKEAREKLNAFVEKHGSFHATFNDVVPTTNPFSSLWDIFWL